MDSLGTRDPTMESYATAAAVERFRDAYTNAYLDAPPPALSNEDGRSRTPSPRLDVKA
ncbi:hypothetical protein [Paludisphaera rhizosphaerae]|uniref:hypothetical protein n=1 Tax=Paludisphaera rhizosphaerae TaxID=2711216 RepID=UPI0013EAE9B7|nr:hypothetical protein [Paludisphaera rhizosphaerae]